MRLLHSLCAVIPLLASTTAAVALDVNSASSISAAAKTISEGLIAWYSGDQPGMIPGLLPGPYYWWEAGGMWGVLIEYWYYTGDTTYNEIVSQAIQFQVGAGDDFMPVNQTKDLGNDDQVFWAFTAMTAAELGFPAPPSGDPSWLSLAQAVFNEMLGRWDGQSCGGGLRWQIYLFNDGYNYKNAIANLGFFQLAARLARYTGNQTYADKAEMEWDWFSNSVLWDAEAFQIYDGTDLTQNCTTADHTQWTYNYGTALAGFAYMYNFTGDAKWLNLAQGTLKTTLSTFFPTNDILVEISCQPKGDCDTDQLSFRTYLPRWFIMMSQLCPTLASQMEPYIKASAAGAAGQCDGGANGTTCGMNWATTTYDAFTGVGQEMSALSVVQSLMYYVNPDLKPPLTLDTGGNSTSNPGAGSDSSSSGNTLGIVYTEKITTADRAGAGIVTAIILMGMTGGGVWLSFT